MQQGEYIIDRWIVQAIEQICQAREAKLYRYSDDWILEIHQAGKIGRVFGYKFSLNNSASANLAQDKVGAYELLTSAGITTVPHRLLRTKVGQLSFPDEWSEYVLKPLVGTSGHLVQAFTSSSDAQHMLAESSVEAWAISPRLDIQKETRLVILDGNVLIGYDKHPQDIDGLKMFNLGKGATPIDIIPTDDMIHIAVRAQRALGLRVCAVDIVELSDGSHMILEVNDGIMMERYSRYSKYNQQNAYKAYEAIIAAMLEV